MTVLCVYLNMICSSIILYIRRSITQHTEYILYILINFTTAPMYYVLLVRESRLSLHDKVHPHFRIILCLGDVYLISALALLVCIRPAAMENLIVWESETPW